MSGNKCRAPIYSRHRPAAIRPPARLPPQGLVRLRLLSCPHISRVHWKRVNIPASSVCSGLTQQKAEEEEATQEGRVEGIFGQSGVTVADRPPAVCRLEACCPPKWLTNPNNAPRPPGCLPPPFLPLLFSLLILEFAHFPGN